MLMMADQKGKKMKEYSNIMKAAEKYGVEIYREMPEGWKVTAGALTAPRGVVWINNGKSLFKGERKAAFLVDFTALRWELVDEIQKMNKFDAESDRLEEIDEAAADEAYSKAWAHYMAASELVAILTGQTEKEARTLVRGSSDIVLKLCKTA